MRVLAQSCHVRGEIQAGATEQNEEEHRAVPYPILNLKRHQYKANSLAASKPVCVLRGKSLLSGAPIGPELSGGASAVLYRGASLFH